MTIRVLIVDDSMTMRKLLQERLSHDPSIEVVGNACDAAEARALMKTLNPDVVTLDIEMPGMDGLSFLKKIMELRPTPVIIVSGSTQEGNSTTAQAMALGAVGCYAKSDGVGGLPFNDDGRLCALVHEASQVKYSKPKPAPASAAPRERSPAGAKPKLITIGSSTGGIEALRTALSGFTKTCPPTLVVQHINARFAPAIAQTLDAVCEAKVIMAEHDTPLKEGHVYFAPGGDKHMTVAGRNLNNLRCVLRPGDPVSGHIPSVDTLFSSAARIAGARALGVLLTGMGEDGAKGLLKMAEAGADTIAQDEASCVVFGMPRAAIKLGAAKSVLPLDEIASHLTTWRQFA